MNAIEPAVAACRCQELDLWKAAVASATDLIGIFSFSDFFDAVASHMAAVMDAGGAARFQKVYMLRR